MKKAVPGGTDIYVGTTVWVSIQIDRRTLEIHYCKLNCPLEQKRQLIDVAANTIRERAKQDQKSE